MSAAALGVNGNAHAFGVEARDLRVAEDRASLAIAEHAADGNPEVAGWCATCAQRAVPMRDGTCGFCGGQVEMPESPPREAEREPSVPHPPELVLGDELRLPLDAATQSLAILAVKGAGKSNAAAVLAEELFDEGIPWIVIDPKGDWWGIRESVEGSRGLPVLVMGGLHGDLPLSPYAGATVAELIVARDLICVLDISAMDDEQRPEFLETLGTRLFELHRLKPTVRHVIVEEAQEVVPQGASKEMRPTLRAWTRIVCQGRQRGLGITLVSQRSALVSKDVLTQTGSLVVLRTTSPQDRAVIRSWTDFHSVSKELVDSLPGLANGEAWIVAPSWLDRVERVRLRRRWTFDSGSTPEVVASRQAQTIESVDIAEIGRLLEGEDTDAQEETPVEPAQAKALVLSLLEREPRRRAELLDATGLSPWSLYRLLRELADEGVAQMDGTGRGAYWHLVDNEPEPEPETQTANPVSDASVAPPLLNGRAAQEAIAAIDELLGTDGSEISWTDMLRARYLAALLRGIEAGDTRSEMLDRFERLAGLAPGAPSEAAAR